MILICRRQVNIWYEFRAFTASISRQADDTSDYFIVVMNVPRPDFHDAVGKSPAMVLRHEAAPRSSSGFMS